MQFKLIDSFQTLSYVIGAFLLFPTLWKPRVPHLLLAISLAAYIIDWYQPFGNQSDQNKSY